MRTAAVHFCGSAERRILWHTDDDPGTPRCRECSSGPARREAASGAYRFESITADRESRRVRCDETPAVRVDRLTLPMAVC